MNITQSNYEKAKKLIPGGTQLLSKRPEMFLPGVWPAYYKSAEGCKVLDLDNKEYMDMSYMGIGANVLGYCDVDVNKAVVEAVNKSSMCTLNSPEEVELAELLTELHPWADMVRYAKTGGEAMSIAVRIARAHTNKDVILFCGYHGWSDWYLGANLAEDSALDGHLIKGLNPKGVPRGLKGTSFPFNYNNIQEFNELIDKYDNQIAAVVMEPIRNDYPEEHFLDRIREVTREKGIALIYDEITAGFRLCCGGSHKVLDVVPDIAVLGKALSNGYPMAAIIGKKNIMEAAQETFISSTYWTDRIGLCASISTIRKYKSNNVEKHLNYIGKIIQDGWILASKESKLDIHVSGIYPLGHFEFLYSNALELKSIFVQEMLKRGFLATNAFYASLAHKERDVNMYLAAVEEVFTLMSKSIASGNIHDMLEGPICHAGFQRLT